MINGRSKEGMKNAMAKLRNFGHTDYLIGKTGDVENESFYRMLIKDTAEKFGCLDILITNLAITAFAVKSPLKNMILSNMVRAETGALIKLLSLELGALGIRFNSILSGWTLTGRIDSLLSDKALKESTAQQIEMEKLLRQFYSNGLVYLKNLQMLLLLWFLQPFATKMELC